MPRKLDSDYMYVSVPGAMEVRGCATFSLPIHKLQDIGSFPFPSDPPAFPSTLAAHFKCLLIIWGVLPMP